MKLNVIVSVSNTERRTRIWNIGSGVRFGGTSRCERRVVSSSRTEMPFAVDMEVDDKYSTKNNTHDPTKSAILGRPVP